MAKVAFIVDELFEDSEFRIPYEAVKLAGHEPLIIGLKRGKELKGKKGKETIKVEAGIDDVSPADFALLVIPGGYSPDHLRGDPRMVEFVRGIAAADKTIAAVCHGGWMLAEADLLEGRTVTSWPSIKTDLVNAGATWVDQELVEDGNFITSRKPEDLEAFAKAIVRHLGSRKRAQEPAPTVH